ncbi:hypothetical protein JOD43_003537 [Pullulanibacillus pueri]|uniref:DUF4030 domain-containing protein n=1 Tax=Pullulanibacillus pueri TaxID=1437324 RepID=A0A8J3ENG8_9BACL|nr:DUF4030 domain-containing protein [Pullulanibacillus pueri]MBM7683357.1 hypothetical protein [Pullulanibacillus pueri]GGH86608.1 hypothetical protein GCM10007096_34710 [Pullulanibacillus pueri]
MSAWSNYFKEEIDKIQVPQDELDILVEKTFKKAGKKEKSIDLKWITVSGVAILLIGLFISSTFVSPAMAKVASKIPIIKLMYHPDSERIISVVQSKLKEKGYKVDSVGYSVNPKKLYIHIDGSAAYMSEVKAAVKKETQNILDAKGYDAFSISVSNSSKKLEDDEINNGQNQENTPLAKLVSTKLKQLDYPGSVSVDENRKMIDITLDLNDFKGDFKKARKAIPKQIRAMSEFKEGYSGYVINVMGMSVSKTDPASTVLSDLNEILISKKDYKVTGTGYKNHPLQFMVYTAVSSSDPNVKAYTHHLESAIQQYLKSDDVSKILDGKTYKLIIYSKGGTKIN